MNFAALFEYATEGILVTDNRGTIVLANPAAETLFGYATGELIGQPVEVLIPQRYAKRHERHREHFSGAPRPRKMGSGLDLFGRKKDDSEFPVEVSLSPFHVEEGDFVIAFTVDNTLYKQHEDAILQQKKELEELANALKASNEDLEKRVTERTWELETAKNALALALAQEQQLGEMKSRFVSMASHEFRTPLTVIASSASLIETYVDRQDAANVKKHAGRIKNAVDNLVTILGEFLSLGKLEEGKMQANFKELNLREAVEDVAAEMKHIFKPGQVFNYRHTSGETVLLDGGLLKNVLINLISNAIKYSPERANIQVRSEVQTEIISIEVQDEGIGIPEADLQKLFTRFFRAENAVATQGTGLGLYIVKCYVEMMNGRIACDSRLGVGSTFRVEFEKNGV